MMFEDLHWIDPTSLELLSLHDRADRQPAGSCCSRRPGRSSRRPGPTTSHVSTLTLSRLGRAEGQALVDGITKGKALPPEVLDQIVARTDGVPLFIEELTKTVLESGLLRDAGDRYELTGPLPRLAIPSTLHASLLARLDRLAPVKDVAQIGGGHRAGVLLRPDRRRFRSSRARSAGSARAARSGGAGLRPGTVA